METEWLEADGCGGFASGTVRGMRTRRYHALLLSATTPPTGRVVLVNGFDAWLETTTGAFALSTQCYAPEVLHPDGSSRIVGFRSEPWPTWTFRAEDGSEVVQEIAAVHGSGEVVLRWRLTRPMGPTRLIVRPLLSGRGYHTLHHENPAFRFEPEMIGDAVVWRPYPDLPAVVVRGDGGYWHEPLWFRDFLYIEERDRGLDHVEDLVSPGSFVLELGEGAATLVLTAVAAGDVPPTGVPTHELLEREAERRRGFASPLHRAADAYIVSRGTGRTILAGYPWFTDWGRDTFITLRGFMTLPDGLETARDILVAWAGAEDGGMLPNRFPDTGEAAEYNSVDAALWYVIAVHDFLAEARRQDVAVGDRAEAVLRGACERIIAGYSTGTRFGIRVDDDGLVAAGVPGTQLTWMDAKIGDWVVTPRIGKPVEIQALWINTLRLVGAGGGTVDTNLERRASHSFRERFWNAETGCLYDVIDVDHVAGRNDPALRPNQILAVGGLPHGLLEPAAARSVVDAVESRLLTPLGLRSLAPGEPSYRPHFRGGMAERDSAYHQGTVWPCLMGPFVDAWLRTRYDASDHRAEVDARFVEPLRRHLAVGGLGHVSEVADAEPPHEPGGCPFQAWSLAELLRIMRLIEEGERPAEAAEET